jgi:diadenosine tetraphosphate (Ap4A) HIT family hydrolase
MTTPTLNLNPKTRDPDLSHVHWHLLPTRNGLEGPPDQITKPTPLWKGGRKREVRRSMYCC